MRKLAIVGSHSSSRELAPFDDLDFDIWVFNEAAQKDWCKRTTGVFQLHQPGIYRSKHNLSHKGHWDWLRQHHSYPIWMLEADPDVPDAVKYPLDALVEKLGCRKYFTSTIVFSMALSAYLGYREVHMYGIEMASQTEYHYQRDCVRYWAGFLDGYGVNVTWHCADDLFNDILYGYDGTVIQKSSDLLVRKQELEAQLKTMKKFQLEKELEFDQALIDRGNPTPIMSELSTNGFTIGQFEGSLSEVTKYYEMARGLEAEFGHAMIDRAYFEVDAAKQKKDIEEKSAATLRQAGRLDYASLAFKQYKDTKTERMLRGFWKEFMDFNYDYGYAMGIVDENHRLATIYDKQTRAAGGEKSYQVMKAELENVEV